MSKTVIKVESFRPIKDKVFVTDLEAGPQLTRGGIIIPDDNMTDRGIHERWGRVWAVGPNVSDIKVGEWILVEHGRWSFGIDIELPDGVVRVWQIDYPSAVLLASDSAPGDRTKTVL